MKKRLTKKRPINRRRKPKTTKRKKGIWGDFGKFILNLGKAFLNRNKKHFHV